MSWLVRVRILLPTFGVDEVNALLGAVRRETGDGHAWAEMVGEPDGVGVSIGFPTVEAASLGAAADSIMNRLMPVLEAELPEFELRNVLVAC